MNNTFEKILDKVNVESVDNGKEFTLPARRNNIKKLLKNSSYKIINQTGLALIYAKKNYNSSIGCIVISNHIDSLYPKHFSQKFDSSQWLGTFDNSICNAVIINLMLSDVLPANVLVSFTGSEEKRKCRGAAETYSYFSQNGDKHLLDLMITLDVTNLGYKNESFTIENYYASKNNVIATLVPRGRSPLFRGDEAISGSRSVRGSLKYKNSKAFIEHLKSILSDKFLTKKYAWPDESHYYAKKDLNCFSFCIPTASYHKILNWMHSPKGILLKEKSVDEYSNALKKLVKGLSKDLSNWKKTLFRTNAPLSS